MESCTTHEETCIHKHFFLFKNNRIFNQPIFQKSTFSSFSTHLLIFLIIFSRGSYVPEPALTTWCRGIRGSINLKILHLENTQLSGRPFSLLCVALHHNRSVNELYLSDNELNTTDMKSLSFALKTNRVIGHLDLRNNNLQDSGVRELVYGLNQQLQHYQNSEEVKLKEKKEEEEKEKDLLENDAIDKVSIGATSTNTEVFLDGKEEFFFVLDRDTESKWATHLNRVKHSTLTRCQGNMFTHALDSTQSVL